MKKNSKWYKIDVRRRSNTWDRRRESESDMTSSVPSRRFYAGRRMENHLGSESGGWLTPNERSSPFKGAVTPVTLREGAKMRVQNGHEMGSKTEFWGPATLDFESPISGWRPKLNARTPISDIRGPKSDSRIRSRPRNPTSEVQNLRSEDRNPTPGSDLDPKSTSESRSDPESDIRGPKWVPNPRSETPNPRSETLNPRSETPNPRSEPRIRDLKSKMSSESDPDLDHDSISISESVSEMLCHPKSISESGSEMLRHPKSTSESRSETRNHPLSSILTLESISGSSSRAKIDLQISIQSSNLGSEVQNELRIIIWDLKSEIRDLKSEISILKYLIWELKSEIRDLKSEILNLEPRIHELKSEIWDPKSKISSLKSLIWELKSGKNDFWDQFWVSNPRSDTQNWPPSSNLDL